MIGVSINILNKSHLALLAQPLADLTQQFHNWELLLKCYPSGDSIPLIICNIMQNLCGKCIESNNIGNKSRLWLILPINPLGMTEDGQIIRHSYLKSVFYHTKSFTCKRYKANVPSYIQTHPVSPSPICNLKNIVASNSTDLYNVHSLQAVNRMSEAQLSMSEHLN